MHDDCEKKIRLSTEWNHEPVSYIAPKWLKDRNVHEREIVEPVDACVCVIVWCNACVRFSWGSVFGFERCFYPCFFLFVCWASVCRTFQEREMYSQKGSTFFFIRFVFRAYIWDSASNRRTERKTTEINVNWTERARSSTHTYTRRVARGHCSKSR